VKHETPADIGAQREDPPLKFTGFFRGTPVAIATL